MCGSPNPVHHRKQQRAVTAAMTGFAIFATVHVPLGSDTMTENQKNLNRAHAAMKEFRAEMETEGLRYKKAPGFDSGAFCNGFKSFLLRFLLASYRPISLP